MKERGDVAASSPEAAVEQALQAHRSQDAGSFASQLAADHTEFDAAGGRLFEASEGGGLTGVRSNLDSAFQKGLKFDVQARDLKSRQYGDTAVVTGYLSGSINDGSGAKQGEWRFTD